MTTSILDTRQRYSPIARASEKAADARKAYQDAGTRYLMNPSLENSNALDAARIALEDAEELQAQAGTIWKYTEGKKRPRRIDEGSDNTLSGSLKDAGFGDFGPL